MDRAGRPLLTSLLTRESFVLIGIDLVVSDIVCALLRLFPCNFTITNVLQYVLPQRIFHEGDQVPFVKDMRRLENRATLLLELIYKYNEARNGKFERTWEFAMCTEPGRAIGRKMFTFGVFRPVLLVEGSLQLIEIMRDTPLKTQCGVPVPTPANHRRMD